MRHTRRKRELVEAPGGWVPYLRTRGDHEPLAITVKWARDDFVREQNRRANWGEREPGTFLREQTIPFLRLAASYTEPVTVGEFLDQEGLR